MGVLDHDIRRQRRRRQLGRKKKDKKMTPLGTEIWFFSELFRSSNIKYARLWERIDHNKTALETPLCEWLSLKSHSSSGLSFQGKSPSSHNKLYFPLKYHLTVAKFSLLRYNAQFCCVYLRLSLVFQTELFHQPKNWHVFLLRGKLKLRLGVLSLLP